jgi:toxin ParE1/3/4
MAAIYASIEFIRRNPAAAERTTVAGVRAKVVQRHNFKVFYRADDQNIEIMHIRHTARRPWRAD